MPKINKPKKNATKGRQQDNHWSTLSQDISATTQSVKKLAKKTKRSYDLQDQETKDRIKKGVLITVAVLAGLMILKKMSKQK